MTADLAALGTRFRLLTNAKLRAGAGPTTFSRGQAYAAQGRVTGLTITGTWEVSAQVRGSGRSYHTRLELYLNRGELLWTGECTCPMEVECKHAVALAIVARQTFGLAGGATGGAAGRVVGGAVEEARPGESTPPAQLIADWADRAGLTRIVATRPELGRPDVPGARALARPDVPVVPSVPAWERALREVVGDAATATQFTPVGLLFEVQRASTYRYAPPGVADSRITVRPVVPGKSGWVRTGLTWGNLDFVSPYGHLRINPAHQSALQALVAAARQPYGYRPIADRVDLAALGRGWFAALQECRRAGIRLLTDAKHSGEVTLAAEPARVVLHLTSGGDGALFIEPVVVAPAEILAAETPAQEIGTPPAGLWVASSDDLVIAAFDSPVDSGTHRWLTQGALRVPPADVPRFFAGHLPALAKRFEVLSPDESIDVPSVGAPRLLLRVTHEPGLRISLAWSFTYAVGSDRVVVPVGSAADAAVRDLAAEAALIDGLDALDKAPGLRTVRPTGDWQLQPVSGLDGSAMLRFLNLVLPRLEEHPDVDIEILGEPVPYAEADEAPTVRLAITESSESTDWFDLDVQVRVGEQDVPIRTLVTALTLGEEHVILPSGTWFRVDRPELQELRRLIDEARAMSDDPKGPLRLSAYHADLWAELEELGVVQEQSERWRSLVAGLASAAEGAPLEPVEAPAGLAAELRHYQHSGYEWLTFLRRAGLGGILADDMGLGKTMQTLAMVLRAVADRAESTPGESASRATEAGAAGAEGERTAYPPFLVVAPTSVLPVWLAEAARFAPSLRVVALGETTRRRGGSIAAAVAGADLVVTTYAVFRIDADAFRECAWSGLILDEAQFVKNHQSQVYQCARLLPAPTKIAITGTPMENNLMELWSLLSIVAPGLFPRPSAFQEHFRRPIESGAAPERLDTLRRRIRPVMLRRTKEAVASELPPKQEQVIEVALSPRHRRIYDRVLAHERQRILGLLDDAQRNRIAILRSLTRMRRLCLDPVLDDPAHAGIGSAKVDALLELLGPVLSEGHQALVFSQFTGYLATVRSRLDAEGISYAYLDGRTRKREEAIESFRSGERSLFLVSLKAGGFGLTLTEADYVFLLDPWWNPATEAQAIDRTHRIGQDKHVFVYRLVAADTIEDKVLALQARKRELFARVVDEGALSGGALSADDIRGLL